MEARVKSFVEKKGITFRHARADIDDRVAAIEGQITATGASVSICDSNGDGLLDLYACTSAEGEPNALYENQGDGTFQDVAEAVGLADMNRPGEGCSNGSVWADYDNDGDLDLFLMNHSVNPNQNYGRGDQRTQPDQQSGDKLFENQSGKFVDVSKASGIFQSIIFQWRTEQKKADVGLTECSGVISIPGAFLLEAL